MYDRVLRELGPSFTMDGEESEFGGFKAFRLQQVKVSNGVLWVCGHDQSNFIDTKYSGELIAMADKQETPGPISIGGITYYQHPTHWYSDGNAVFLVENTIIQVFGGIINRRSSVLRALLEAPDEIGAHPLDDNLTEFSLFLDAIMPQTCSKPRIPTDKEEWRSLIGLIRVAHKYEVDDIGTRAVEVLEEILPTIQRPDQNTDVYGDPEAAVDVINFARHCHLPQFLRSAFYALVTQEWTNYPLNTNPLTRLSSEDRMRVQQGRMRLQSEVMGMASGRWENCNGRKSLDHILCKKDKDCWGGWGDGAWPKEDDAIRWKNLLWHPLDELKQRAEMPKHRYICTPCWNEFVEANKRMRVDLIDKLANIFILCEDETGAHSGA
ncbi:hypothetical protein FRC00_002055 [Tulasnella sp. 408]|nr:hypothetical protein FRC00_002055 [Tulasnella sp. 408]